MGEVIGGLVVMGLFVAFVLWLNRGKRKPKQSIEDRYGDDHENDGDDDD